MRVRGERFAVAVLAGALAHVLQAGLVVHGRVYLLVARVEDLRSQPVAQPAHRAIMYMYTCMYDLWRARNAFVYSFDSLPLTVQANSELAPRMRWQLTSRTRIPTNDLAAVRARWHSRR